MASATAEKLDVDAFLSAFEGRQGRWELRDGRPLKMSAEQAVHVRVKHRAARALEDAIARAGLPCEAFAEGLTVRIDRDNAYEPDALVNCGVPIPGRSLEAPNPVIVVEVVSPSSANFDRGGKRAGYFSVPAVQHYLIVDAQARCLEHHFRTPHGGLDFHALREGALRLDPPGLDLQVADFLPA